MNIILKSSLPKYPIIFSIIAILAVSATLSTSPAYGHALPTSHSIEPNSILAKDSVPTQLTISFSERPDPKTSYIRALNSANERADNTDFTITAANGRQATVTLDRAKLASDGVYTVSWRTMSLDDGHIAQGSYVFGVGNVSPGTIDQEGQPETTFVTSTSDALLRWPLIVSQAAIVGGVITHIVLQRARTTIEVPIKRFSIILIASSVVIAACGTALVFLQAINLVEDNSASYFDTLQTLIFNSPAGTVWMIRIATSIIVGALAFVLRKARSNVVFAAILVAGAVSIFSNSMLSHNSAATFLPTVAILADWVHFMAVSSWVGGLFYFSAVLYRALKAGNGANNLALALPRFSLIATASLGVIGVTGLYMAWVHLQSFDSLLYTQYGNNLIVKLSAVVPMVLLGAYHQVKLHKAVVVMATVGNGSRGQSGQDAVSRFGKTIKIESLVAIGVLLAASFLTITSPPSHAHEQPAASGYSQKATVDSVEVALNITPFNVGFNTFSVILREGGGAPQNIKAVFLRLTNMDSGTGPIIATLNRTDVGSYSTTGGFLSQAGAWDIDLIVQRSDAYDLNHSFEAQLSTAHQMDMDESEHGQTHETSNVVEEPMPASPVLDSFAILAILLSGAVIASSTYFYKKSQKQLSQTIKELEGHR